MKNVNQDLATLHSKDGCTRPHAVLFPFQLQRKGGLLLKAIYIILLDKCLYCTMSYILRGSMEHYSRTEKLAYIGQYCSHIGGTANSMVTMYPR